MVEITKLSNKSYKEAKDFYNSNEWKVCRKLFLESHIIRMCSYCGIDLNEEQNVKKLQVDHIKPLKYYWDLRIEQTNLQIICEDCNQSKGSFRNPNEGKNNYNYLKNGFIKKELKSKNFYKWLNKKKV